MKSVDQRLWPREASEGATRRRCPGPGDGSARAAGGLALVALLLAAAPAASVAQRTPDPAEIDAIFREWDRPDSPGCALAVVRDGRIVYERGYGYANLDLDVPITPATVFNIASVSKQFTAASIALLVQQANLSLDDDVRKYLPKLRDYGHTITIRHLIHHTSGLRDYGPLMFLAGLPFENVYTMEDRLELITRQRELNFRPGDEQLYSNTGYVLLGEIVRRVSGQSLRGFADAHIFRPLGMTDSHFHDDRFMIVKNRAFAYALDSARSFRLAFFFNWEGAGAGGVLTTVRDLAHWDEALYTGAIGGKEWVKTMHTRGVLNSGDTLGYAFGLVHGQYRGLRTLSHSGSSGGFSATLVRFPDQRFSVIILCNVASADAGALRRRVADLYLADRLRPQAEAEERAEGGRDEEEWERDEVLVANPVDYAGDYRSPELEVTHRVEVRQGGLVLRLRRDEFPLRPAGRDTFRTRLGSPLTGEFAPWATLRFVRAADGRVTLFRIDVGRVRNLLFLKVASPGGRPNNRLQPAKARPSTRSRTVRKK